MTMARRVLPVALLVLGAVAADSTPNDAHIFYTPNGGGGVNFDNAPANVPFTLGDLPVCLDKPGRVVIHRVESYNPFGDLRVDAFAVLPGMHTNDDLHVTVAAEVPHLPVVVERVCPASMLSPDVEHAVEFDPVSFLLIQFSKPEKASAGNEGLIIYYTSNGHKYWVYAPFSVVLCVASYDACV
jgi:hypothetical protein